MKKRENTVRHVRRGVAFAIVGLVALTSIIVGGVLGYRHLRAMYVEKCIITNMERQVQITTGKMIRSENIAELLGLRVGANLADIDFAKKRDELLETVPNLRTVTILRSLPDRVTVLVEERTPSVKMGVCGQRGITGRVADSEGVVFSWRRGTQLLPTIYEKAQSTTANGHRLEGRALAALRLVEACRDPKYSILGVQDVDTTPHDYLKMTIADYSTVKIAWEGMDQDTMAAAEALNHQLDMLANVYRTKLGTGTKEWNATMSDRIFADTKERQ